ncbi:MAG TPA: cation-transporting P-type ATPase, partial [Candidatus Bathyarchaeia archaeon]|nr:cation-transporting P-type ATPase [Candidatus Bathyarchaeia archaeon]
MSQPHSQPVQDLIQLANTNTETGLTIQEAAKRLAENGPNKLVEEREIRFLSILREEITEPMILLLL